MITQDSAQSLNLIKHQKEMYKLVHNALAQLIKKDILYKIGYTQEEIEDDDFVEDIDEVLSGADIVLAGGAPRDWYFGNAARDMDIYICPNEFDKTLYDLCGEKYYGIYYRAKLAFAAMPERDFHLSRLLKDKEEGKNILLEVLGDNLLSNGVNFTSLRDKSVGETDYTNPFIRLVYELKFNGCQFDLIFLKSNAEGPVVFKLAEENITFQTTSPKDMLSTGDFSFGDFVVSTYDFDICRAYYDISLDEVFVNDLFLSEIKNKTLTIYGEYGTRSLHATVFKHYNKLKIKFPDFEFNPIERTK
jgi:hypothetical protein